MTTSDQWRARLPTGRDATLVLTNPIRTRTETVTVTVVEHADRGFYGGLHPDLVWVPYDRIVEVVGR